MTGLADDDRVTLFGNELLNGLVHAEDERAGGIMDLEAFLLEFELDPSGGAVRSQ